VPREPLSDPRPRAVAVVERDGKVLVIRRHLDGRDYAVLPGGGIEDGEAPADAAARELAEECGLAARELSAIGTFWAAPGYSTELVHVFEATGLSGADPADLDDDEDIEVERLPLAGALGALDDAASIAGLALWLELQ